MRPISEIALALMDVDEAEQVGKQLEKRCQCRLSQVSKGNYLLRLPAGSIEEASPQPDPRHREETVITLPNGRKLKKAVKWSCICPGCTHTYVFLLDEPEEEYERKKRRRRYNVNQPVFTINEE